MMVKYQSVLENVADLMKIHRVEFQVVEYLQIISMKKKKTDPNRCMGHPIDICKMSGRAKHIMRH